MVTRKNEKLTVADWTFWMRGDLLPQEQQEVLHFMFTWMQYNSWYSKTYHMKDVLGSVQLSKNKAAQKVYNALKNGFVQSFKMIPYKDEQGSRLGLYGKEKYYKDIVGLDVCGRVARGGFPGAGFGPVAQSYSRGDTPFRNLLEGDSQIAAGAVRPRRRGKRP